MIFDHDLPRTFNIPFHLVCQFCSPVFAMLKNTKLGLYKTNIIITVESPLTATSLQRPFFDQQSIHSLLFQPLYNGQLATMATFFCAQGGYCREVQNCNKNNYCHDWGDFVMVVTAYLVNINGIRCPKCMASDEGPLPVYR